LSLEHIILPPSSIAALYRNTLVSISDLDLSEEKKTGGLKEHIPYRYMGENRKRISLLVNLPGPEILAGNHLQFLTRILEACKLKIDDVAILNHAHQPVSNTSLKKQLNPESVVMFGITPPSIELPLNFPVFKLHGYDSVNYLAVPSIDQLNQNNEEGKLLKSKLWVCLRQLFNV
jgi:hypothetical protein